MFCILEHSSDLCYILNSESVVGEGCSTASLFWCLWEYQHGWNLSVCHFSKWSHWLYSSSMREKSSPMTKITIYLWGLLKGLCNFYGLTFLAEVLCFLVSQLLSHLRYIWGMLLPNIKSLLLCPVWSRSWIFFSHPNISCPWLFLSYSFFCAVLSPAVLKWVSLDR